MDLLPPLCSLQDLCSSDLPTCPPGLLEMKSELAKGGN